MNPDLTSQMMRRRTPTVLVESRPSASRMDNLHTIRRLLSGRNLDMCLLAICSCVLSLVVHQSTGMLNLPTVSASSVTPTSSATPAQIDFLIKAGLRVSSQPMRLEEEGDER
ncbi:MAG: hypothetical protein VKK04_01515 [Synechococcales bacterium]|nr:hypothetical protein [Synechococcales bacterium]